MINPAYLVDGHLEQKFIQKACPGRPVRLINCNGDNVEIPAIAKRVATLCRSFGNKYYPIIVIIDREERDETSIDLCSTLLLEIKQEGITDTIVLAVADRQIENWILSDAEIVNQHPNNRKPVPYPCEGLNGKKIISACLNSYHETTIGVDLLLECRPSRMRENSTSFAFLYNQLPKKGCRWLSR